MNLQLISSPIVDLKELFSWAEEDRIDVNYADRRIPLKTDKCSPVPYPHAQILMCHDMQNGYLHDVYAQGCSCTNVYSLMYPQAIDLFIYFTHHLVSLPTPQWIDMCHLNGIPILGTFITEGSKGSEICAEMFKNEESALKLVKSLLHICNWLQFDGWFINIENPLSCEHQSYSSFSNLEIISCIFLPALRDGLNKSGNKKLMWYDSVTCHGELLWQNKLNNFNSSFFDSCGEIFLNYNWTSSDLVSSKRCANTQSFNVYAGIDVFGRNCVGGYQSSEALSTILDSGLSAAIFAPGWVWETLERDDFLRNQHRFWSSISSARKRSKTIDHIPFATCFCTGRGIVFKTLRKGWNSKLTCKVSANCWSYLPMTTWIPLSDQVFPTEIDSFIGGSCLVIPSNDSILIAKMNVLIQAFELTIAYKAGKFVIEIEYMKDDSVCYLFLCEKNSKIVYKMDEWTVRRHNVSFESQCNLTSLSIQTHADVPNMKLGLLSINILNSDRAEKNEIEDYAQFLDPRLFRIYQFDSILYIIVSFQNILHEIVNVYRDDVDEYTYIGSSTNNMLCILFKMDRKEEYKNQFIQLEFAKWKTELLNLEEFKSRNILYSDSCIAFENLDIPLQNGEYAVEHEAHISKKDEQIFSEMLSLTSDLEVN